MLSPKSGMGIKGVGGKECKIKDNVTQPPLQSGGGIRCVKIRTM